MPDTPHDNTLSTDQVQPSVTSMGPYRLIHLLAVGGMGEVWRAEQTKPFHRTVALKLIKAGMDTRAVVARFDSERQALALMEHPNIAKVFDAGTSPAGRPYFVMEYVPGVAITEYCAGVALRTPHFPNGFPRSLLSVRDPTAKALEFICSCRVRNQQRGTKRRSSQRLCPHSLRWTEAYGFSIERRCRAHKTDSGEIVGHWTEPAELTDHAFTLIGTTCVGGSSRTKSNRTCECG